MLVLPLVMPKPQRYSDGAEQEEKSGNHCRLRISLDLAYISCNEICIYSRAYARYGIGTNTQQDESPTYTLSEPNSFVTSAVQTTARSWAGEELSAVFYYWHTYRRVATVRRSKTFEVRFGDPRRGVVH
jgi:hypothetical protein